MSDSSSTTRTQLISGLLEDRFCPPEGGFFQRSYPSHTGTFPDSGNRHRWCVRGEFPISAALAAAHALPSGDCPDDGCRLDHLRRQDRGGALRGSPGSRAVLVRRPRPSWAQGFSKRSERLVAQLWDSGWHRPGLLVFYVCSFLVPDVEPDHGLGHTARLESEQ